MSPSPEIQHRPEHLRALGDARGHLVRAVAAIRAAATLDPLVARDVAIVHSVLCDQIEVITRLERRP